MKATSIQTSFTVGEVSPRLLGRIDMDQYYAGLETCRNYTLMPHGGATKRPGMRFIAEAKYPNRRCRVICFEFSTQQAYALEIGHEYIRFYKDQGQIVDSGSPYEIETPYTEDDLWELSWAQSADVLFINHPLHTPRMLKRTGHTAWTLEECLTLDGPYIDENTDARITIQASATGERIVNGGFDSNINGWEDKSSGGTSVVQWDASGWMALIADGTNAAIAEQAVSVTGGQETTLNFEIKSGPVSMRIGTTSGGADAYSDTAFNTGLQEVKFTPATTGLVYVQFYHSANASRAVDNVSMPTGGTTTLTVSGGSLFQSGHVGSIWRIRHGASAGYVRITAVTSATSATAEIVEPLASTDPTTFWREGAWSDFRGWPRAITFHEGRLWHGGTSHQPQHVWGSVSNDFFNFAPGAEDADAITLEIMSNTVNAIRWLRSARALMAGTVAGEWRIGDPNSNTALTPATAYPKLENTDGSSLVPPLAVGGALLFVQRAGRKLRELAYSYSDDRWTAPDMTILSEHITQGGIKEMAYAREPDSIVWCIRGDGVLLGFTYNRLEKVVGWHRHETQGQFESVAAIPGVERDEPWFVVRRTVNGQERRYIEVMENTFDDQDKADAFFVDSGLSYDGPPAAVISGLDHLEGCQVVGLADGGVVGPFTVSDGSVTLPAAAEKAHLGLAYVSDLGLLPVEGGSEDGSSQAKIKKLVSAAVLLHRALGLKIGPTADLVETVPFWSSATPFGQSPELFSGWRTLEMDSDYERSGTVHIRHDQPLPCTVLAVVRHYETMAI